MKTSTLLGLTLGTLTLVACTTAQPGPGTPAATSLTIKPITSVTTEANGMTRTIVTLKLTGTVNDDLKIDNTEADGPQPLQYIDPKLYKDTDILAAFFNYYAGGGYQIAVRKTAAGLVVDKRDIYEGSAESVGGCGAWTQLKKYTIPEGTTITWTGVGIATSQLVIECGTW